MNSFERFETVISNKKPDKMPFYFPTIACSVASEILGREANTGGESLHFKEELSLLYGEEAHKEFVQQLHQDLIEINRKLEADVVRETWRSCQKPVKKLDDYTLLFGDEHGKCKIKRYFPKTQSYGVVEDKMSIKSVDELKHMLIKHMEEDISVSDEQLYSIYIDQLKFKKLADPYFPTIAGVPGIGVPMYDPVWLEATALEPEILADYFMYSAERIIRHIAWLRSRGFKWINGGMDVASNMGPVYSPPTFKKLIVPALRKISDECNKLGVIYCYRTDGNIWSMSDYMFIDAGVQAYGEVDRGAGMKVGELRSRYPELIILGNIDSNTLHVGSEEQVRLETRESLEESEGYNYIAGPSNAIMHGTPIRNIYAMIDEIDKYRP